MNEPTLIEMLERAPTYADAARLRAAAARLREEMAHGHNNFDVAAVLARINIGPLAPPSAPGVAREPDCVKCIKCSSCVGACDCTGGPQTEQECTCYELTGGHMPGCYFNRRPPTPVPAEQNEMWQGSTDGAKWFDTDRATAMTFVHYRKKPGPPTATPVPGERVQLVGADAERALEHIKQHVAAPPVPEKGSGSGMRTPVEPFNTMTLASDGTKLQAYVDGKERPDLVVQPNPGSGMEPGQRCTLSEHSLSGHAFDADDDRDWLDHGNIVYGTRRCPYVQPAPEPTPCAAWCGYRDPLQVGLPRLVQFCTPACRDAGRPLNPRKP